MVVHPEVKKNILVKLIAAEKSGEPITLDQALSLWGNGSTWENLAATCCINRNPKAVTVTGIGKEWLNKTFPEVNIDEIQPSNFDEVQSLNIWNEYKINSIKRNLAIMLSSCVTCLIVLLLLFNVFGASSANKLVNFIGNFFTIGAVFAAFLSGFNIWCLFYYSKKNSSK